LCGVGRLPIPPDWAPTGMESVMGLPLHLGETALLNGRRALFVAMSQGSPRAQAAVALWRSTGYALSRLPKSDAPNPPSASDVALFSLLEPAPAVVAKFAALAERDPVIAQWGLATCRDDAACRAQAAARWLRAEPDNALAWASTVNKSSSPAALAEARAGVAKAQRASVHSGAFVGAVLASMPADVPPYVQQMLLNETLAIDMGEARAPVTLMAPQCPAETEDATRQQCDVIARLLIDRSDSLSAQSSGVTLGFRMGWPAADVAARREAGKALRASGFPATESKQGDSCQRAKTIKSWMTALAEEGEMVLFQERVQAAGVAAAQGAWVKR
jgi:hypothetical protein